MKKFELSPLEKNLFFAKSESPKITTLTFDRRPVSEIRRNALEEGMTLLRQSAVDKALLGQTSFQEINKVTFVE